MIQQSSLCQCENVTRLHENQINIALKAVITDTGSNKLGFLGKTNKKTVFTLPVYHTQ